MLAPYDRVAKLCETECPWVRGFKCQGEVLPKPNPSANSLAKRAMYPNAYARRDLRELQRASTVRTEWIVLVNSSKKS
jgi:hypothetical protein